MNDLQHQRSIIPSIYFYLEIHLTFSRHPADLPCRALMFPKAFLQVCYPRHLSAAVHDQSQSLMAALLWV